VEKDMGAPIDTPLTGDILSLSIDDLLAPLPETQRLGGPGPFVINLSASITPIGVPAKGIAGCEHLHVFLVQRMEDRRLRYRLRLGPFVSEDGVEAVLDRVRAIYPSALTATADAEDLRVLASMQAKTGTPPPKTDAPPLKMDGPQSKTDAPQSKIDVPQPITAKRSPTISASPAPAEVVPSLSLLAVPAGSAAVPLELVPSPPRILPASPEPPSPRAAVPTVTKAVPSPRKARSEAIPPATAASPMQLNKPAQQNGPVQLNKPIALNKPLQLNKPAQLSKPVPTLDTTQTVRTLTQLELEGDQASGWFVIQLALAEEAFDPEALPSLDIFNAYRLYSVAGIDQGRIVHALRMGFFSEEVGARAVASYLAAYYENPTVKRVNMAERQRFADQRLEPRKDVGATGKQAVIEITGERFVRDRRSSATVQHKGR
jgi:hypothetical protein